MRHAHTKNARIVRPGRSRDDIAGTVALAPQLARLLQSLMNTVSLIVQCDTETPHSLAGMAGGPSSRGAFISKKGTQANLLVRNC